MSLHEPKELLRFILRSSKRIAVLVVGLALVFAGVVMIVVPGPGLLVILAGLAVLATEFAWAEAMLARARDTASKARRGVRSLPPTSSLKRPYSRSERFGHAAREMAAY